MLSYTSSAQPETTPAIRISLESLAIPKENMRLLEGHLEHKVREELAKAHPAITFASVCASGIPGTQVDLSQILNTVTSVPPKNGKWVMAWFASGDAFRIDISSTRLSRTDQAVVGLANICSSCWAKEIEIFSICQGNMGTIHLDSCNAVPNFGLLSLDGGRGASTIIFRKPKILGWWTDMYYPDPSTFWEIFGGRTITFTWVDDNGAKPPPVTTGAITVRRSNGTLFTPNEDWTNNPYFGSRGTFFADVT